MQFEQHSLHIESDLTSLYKHPLIFNVQPIGRMVYNVIVLFEALYDLFLL